MQTDEQRAFRLSTIVSQYQTDVDYLDRDRMDDVEIELITNQYAYIKFGLMLEKIRNQSWWNRCNQKFRDFKQFCESTVNLSIWQVANAIKSAQVAARLAFLGFTDLPRNASQALKMADLSIERLAEVWGKVTASGPAHKITAMAIESTINPDKQPTSSTLRVPAAVADGLARQAIELGLSLQEYLRRLASGEDLDHGRVNEIIDDGQMNEIGEVVNALDLKFAAIANPKKIIRESIELFDQSMHDLIGRFIPAPIPYPLSPNNHAPT